MNFSPTIIAKLRERAERHRELGELLADPEVAGDHKRYTEFLREQGLLEESARLTAELDRLISRREEAQTVAAGDGSDAELVELATMELEEIEGQEAALDHSIKAALVSDAENERDKAIVEIRAGTGGDEATLFCADLFRMYQRYSETKGWKVEVMNQKSSEVGGMKEIVFGVKGASAYRLLRFEAGGHRVQRVPQTESQGRIHTSAATVAVLPEAEEVDLDLKAEDLRIDTMRASGAGGQHVNKTESAVRIVHEPTGVMVVCMDEKSQHKNRAQAMRILRSRLFELERRRIHEERAQNRKSQVGSGDRSERVRTYNFPQNRCSDHRINQNYSLEQVMAGKLQPTIDALEEWDRELRIQEL